MRSDLFGRRGDSIIYLYSKCVSFHFNGLSKTCLGSLHVKFGPNLVLLVFILEIKVDYDETLLQGREEINIYYRIKFAF